jgi:hypothetical protein
MMRARQTAFGLACVAACAAACVPRGDPPAGRHLVADRVTMVGGFARPNGDGVTRVLLLRPPTGGGLQQYFDLYVASVDATGGPAVERLLAANVGLAGDIGCSYGLTGCVLMDARGRVLVTTGYDQDQYVPIMARIDPVTEDRLDLGATPYTFFSPSRERLLAMADMRRGGATLYENDDRVLVLTDATIAQFYGEDLYYVTAIGDLRRIVPGGAPELLATGVTSFLAAQQPEANVMVLTRPTADPTVSSASFLDTVTLQETAAPAGLARFDLSPDGRWLVAFDPASRSATFIERATGFRDSLALSDDFGGQYEWRPGHEEAWFWGGSYSNPTVSIKKPGAPPIVIPTLAYGLSDNDRGGTSMFTRDGAYWFSSRATPDQVPIVQVGSADDPLGTRFDLLPIGARAFLSGYWRLADGRILTMAQHKNWPRDDVYAVDPANGDSRALGEAGFVMAVGQTRALALLHINDNRGDLTAIDLADGHGTVLAPEFTLGAAAEAVGGDKVAPGAHLVYQFQARFESPYDGIWLTTVP